MRTRILTGAIGGLTAGMLFGLMMQMMNAPTPDGKEIPMMSMVAMVVGSDNVIVGWIYHLFNSAFIGVVFGVAMGERVTSVPTGVGIGAAYGFVWWIIGGLILMPIMLGMSPFAPLMMPPMRMVAMGSLIGHLVFGAALGTVSVLIRSRIHGFCEIQS
jgi:uncharacterized membrane protein YagU involved in acid resistance